MKNVFLTLSFILFCFFSFAQKTPKSFMWDEKDLKEIGASEAQISQLLQITKESLQRLSVIRKDPSLSEAEKKAKVSEEYKARGKERRKVVTPEQLKKANQITKERRAANQE